MKYAVIFSLGIWILFTFSGCSEMLQGLRQENDEINAEVEKDRDEKDGGIYGYKPKNLTGVTANNVKNQEPPVMRNYGRRLSSLSSGSDGAGSDEYPSNKRVTREDFLDKAAENSLWDSQGQNNFLFSHNRRRESGDMVTADIEKELRREIQFQLWMTLPPEQRKVKRDPASKGGDSLKSAAGAPTDPNAKAGAKPDKGQDEKGKDAAEEAAKTNMASGGKDDDLIRMEVVENLGNGLVRVVGQKRVIYRGVSRLVEVMALANNKDIDDNNRVKSGAFLDMQTQVVQ